MLKIKISDDFTKSPGGRLMSEGEYSGEQFRNDLLLPLYLKAKEANDKLIIDLDGCYGFATSFIEEAFGGLARATKHKDILKFIEIISDDEPGLIGDIKNYIKDAIINWTGGQNV